MKNGSLWHDTNNVPIQAHGGCILQHNGIWYWYGENKAAPTRNRRVDFLGFSCYSSPDLLHWENRGIVLSPVKEPGHDLSPQAVGERPCVLYHRASGKFILWFHQDTPDYNRAHAGVAVSDTPTGPFTYWGSCLPGGHDSRDLTAYADPSGRAFLFCSSDWNASIRIWELDETYTGFTGAGKLILADQAREAPAIFCHTDVCYMLSSGCTGWHPNRMLCADAPTLLGDWRLKGEPCTGPDARRTFGGQSAHVFSTGGRFFVLLDHWQPDDLQSSGYSILPIEIEDGIVSIPWREKWNGLRAP